MTARTASRGRALPTPKKSAAVAPKKQSTAKNLFSTGVSIASSIASGALSKKKGGGGVHGKGKTAKQMLKRAYERRAKREIRMGNLGLARRTLRKKATVV